MPPPRVREGLAGRLFPAGLAAAVIGFGLYFDHAAFSAAALQRNGAAIDTALTREAASPAVRRVAQWAVLTQDAAGLPFVVIDKAQSRIFAFDPQGHPTGNGAVQAESGAATSGRFVADTIASARSGAIVWVKADAQFAVRPSANESQRIEASLQVEPAFWTDRLASLRTQPSIAYVLPPGEEARRPS